jgi:hypothetical protein
MKPVKRCSMTVLCPSQKSSNPLKMQSIDFANSESTAPREASCIPSHGIQLPVLPQITSWWSCQLGPNPIRRKGRFRPRDLRLRPNQARRPPMASLGLRRSPSSASRGITRRWMTPSRLISSRVDVLALLLPTAQCVLRTEMRSDFRFLSGWSPIRKLLQRVRWPFSGL